MFLKIIMNRLLIARFLCILVEFRNYHGIRVEGYDPCNQIIYGLCVYTRPGHAGFKPKFTLFIRDGKSWIFSDYRSCAYHLAGFKQNYFKNLIFPQDYIQQG